MSVLFATYSEHFVIMCADRQATNIKTGKAAKQLETKVEKWLPQLGVGFCGNMAFGKIIRDAVHHLIDAGQVEDYTIEAVAKLFEEGYGAAREVYPEAPENIVVKFAIAGESREGLFGVAEVYMDAEGPQTAIHVSKHAPKTMIFEPDDVSAEVCNEMMEKALATSRNTNMDFMDLMCLAHQKAVRFVSLRSKLVSAKSDVIVVYRGAAKA